MNKNWIISVLLSIGVANCASAQMQEHSVKSTISCAKEGCSIVCHQPGNRWDTFMKTTGDIEVTNYVVSGNIRYKAPVEGGEYAILETNPNTQFCRITGIGE